MNPDARFDVLLPAGGRIHGDLAAQTGVTQKALIPIGGSTLVERIISELRTCPQVGRIAIAGDPEVANRLREQVDVTAARGETAPRTLVNALRALDKPTRHVLVVTTDLPFLTRASVETFLASCDPQVHINLPIIRATDYEARFPGTTNTYIPLRDGKWTAGGIYLLDSEAFLGILPQLDALFNNRKSKLGMAKLLGPKFFYKFLTKSLTVPDIAAKIRDMTGLTGDAIPGSPPELAFDIDDLTDYEAAQRFLNPA